ncbi:MAG: hypothetical protein M1827_003246 [Pycnora praestabilis]|nr:MAG: hypothetical protein M1827_003246 [Pycnora praestabilis]
MLYIDQPIQTGFSYDLVRKGTVDIAGNVILDDFTTSQIPEQTRHIKIGAFSSNDERSTANSTAVAVRSLWKVIQIWVQDFPEQKSSDKRINIWTSSYGGHYAPALITFTMEQNKRLGLGLLSNKTAISIHFDTLGMTNVCVDALTQIPYYPELMHNATYSPHPINESTYLHARNKYYTPGGCLSQLQACHAAAPTPDFGANLTANALCHSANSYCGKHVVQMSASDQMGLFDMAYPNYVNPYPTSETYLGFLNQAHVQAALGVPINFTANAPTVAKAFAKTGDNAKAGFLRDLGRVLDGGVKVAMVYGDRDFVCNWLGGEALSLSIPHTHAPSFLAAGYTNLLLPNGQPAGAQVRQHYNLSFTIVHNAGHAVSIQRPNITYAIFNRANAGMDIATGTRHVSVNGTCNEDAAGAHRGDGGVGQCYSTTGPRRSRRPAKEVQMLQEMPTPVCYVLNLGACSEEQRSAYQNGTGVVKEYFVVALGDGSCSPNPVTPCDEEDGGLHSGSGWQQQEEEEKEKEEFIESNAMGLDEKGKEEEEEEEYNEKITGLVEGALVNGDISSLFVVVIACMVVGSVLLLAMEILRLRNVRRVSD